MTPEEIAAKLAELESANARMADMETKWKELDGKVNPPAADPDEKFKPKTWEELDGKIDRKAEEIALKVLEDAERRKQEIAQKETDDRKKFEEEIDKALEKLETEGVLSKSEAEGDDGWKQRRQVIGLTVRLGGTDVGNAAATLKSAWDAGMEYDLEKGSFVRRGSAPSQTRMAPVSSSSNRVQVPAGKVNLRGVGGDLDEARRRFEEANR